MRDEYQRTQAEEAFDQLVDEKSQLLSKEARSLLETAHDEAYRFHLLCNYGYEPLEYFMGMEDMVRLSAELSNHEREILAEICRAAAMAAAAIDPEDKRPVGHRVYRGNIHHYYKMMFGMIKEALQPKTEREREEARTRLWIDYADFENRIEQRARVSQERPA